MKPSKLSKVLIVGLLLHAPMVAEAASPSRLVTTQVSIVDSDGFPIENGEYSWKTVDGLASSAKKIFGTALGVLELTSIPTKEVELTISHGKGSDGMCYVGKAKFVPQSGKSRIVLPSYPEPIERRVLVKLPGGQPVPNALVDSRNLVGIKRIITESFVGLVSGSMKSAPGEPEFRCHNFPNMKWHTAWNGLFDGKRQDKVTLKGLTNIEGVVTLKGWPSDDVLQVQANFNDGVLSQKTEFVPIIESGTTELSLDYFPILKTSSEDIDAYMNELVSLPVYVVDSADLEPMSFNQIISEPRITRTSLAGKPSAAFAGVEVQVISPPGSKAPKCAKKQTLKAKTTSSGRALLKFCVTSSGNYQLKGKGAVSLGKVSIHVKGAAPMAPTALSALAGVKKATVAWGLPTYAGGTPITKYIVTATSSGQKTKTVEVKAKTAAFNARKLTLSSLAAPKNWNISVVAVTKYGQSAKSSIYVNIPSR